MNRPLRIGLLMHSVLPRGGVVHTLELATALHAQGHVVTVVAPAEGGQQLFRTLPCTLALLPTSRPTGDLVAQVRQRIAGLVAALPAVLQAGRFDLLHAQDSLNANALAQLCSSGLCPAPWVRTVHHLDDFEAPELAAWQRTGWQAAQAIGCVSDSWCRHFQLQLGRTPQRLYNGVDLQRYSAQAQPDDGARLQALGLPEDRRLTVLALGGVEARKNSTRLLQAFASLCRDDAAWAAARLVLAGGASLLDHSRAQADWQAALAELGLREGAYEAVWRCGPVPDDTVPALMRRAQVLAMPSLVEGFGLVALEALACGTPVLVSRCAPFTEHLSGCEQVAWCEPLDVDSIARGLQAATAIPRSPTPPAVCVQHGWAHSAAVHESWYRQVLQHAAVPA